MDEYRKVFPLNMRVICRELSLLLLCCYCQIICSFYYRFKCRLDPLLLLLRHLGQYPRGKIHFLWLRPDADAKPRKVLTEDVDDRFESVVRPRTAGESQTMRSERNVHVITADEDLLRDIQFVELRQFADAFAGAVHERRRLHEKTVPSLNRRFGNNRHELLGITPIPCPQFFGDMIDGHEPRVVARLLVLLPGIAETDQEEMGLHRFVV